MTIMVGMVVGFFLVARIGWFLWSYGGYRSPRWKHRRRNYYRYHERRCVACGTIKGKIDLHHCFYRSGHHVADYPDSALHPLCDYHHRQTHGLV